MGACLAVASVAITSNNPVVWCFEENSLYDYEYVHKAWQDFIGEDEWVKTESEK